MERQTTANGRPRPTCVGMEEAANIFGWPNYYGSSEKFVLFVG